VTSRFGPDADQAALAGAVREVLADVCPRDAEPETGPAGSARRWAALAELGLLGLAAPERAGGLGAGEPSLVLALEECGRAALPEPAGEVAAVAVPLLADLGDPPGLLPDVLAGRQRLAVGLAGMRLVPGAADADLLLLAEGEERVHLAPAGDVTVRVAGGADPALGLADVDGQPSRRTEIASGPDAANALARAADRGALATAAVLAGLGAGMVELAVDYAKTRTQFGRPIGANQAVKHALADAHLAVEFARPLAHYAAWALANGQPAAARDVSAAKFAAARAAQRVARTALQIHGAIGYTREHPLHRWLIQAWTLVSLHGTPEQHRARVLAALRASQRERTAEPGLDGPRGGARCTE
jgi:alkylation response protein AidB-like acyl-CoA dehydrogenase